jgi:iron(III) transport system substrate-binding protein
MIRGTHWATIAVLLTLGLAACEQPGPMAAPPATDRAAPVEGASDAPADWEARWNDLVQAARREGKLVLAGPPTTATRRELPAAFQRRFNIEVEYLAGPTGDKITQLERERAAGLYTLDVLIGGAASLFTRAYPAGMFDPLRPVLIHPEATDPTKWITGRVWFQDPEDQYIVRLSNYVATHVSVNPELVNPAELRAWKDLLDPKYRGRISAFDPSVSGSGWNTASYLLRTLGEDFVRALYQDQRVAVSRDRRQLADWMGRGTHPISIGLSSADIEPMKADGLPVAVVPEFPEAPGYVASGFGTVGLMDGAPHPNAAALFVNWIMMTEGNEVWNRGQGFVSVRTDVDNVWAPSYVVPKPGLDYFDGSAWDYTVNAFTPESLQRIRHLTGQ